MTFRNSLVVRLPILMYHHIGPVRPGTNISLTISPGKFERQLRWLKASGYQTIGSREWLDHVSGAKPLSHKPVMLTFDDGYRDLIEFALPRLRSLGMKAILYIVTGCIGGTNLWDRERGFGGHSLMDLAQIRQWRDSGLEIGAHSRTHPQLPELSAEQREVEIAGSREDLETILGQAPLSFAYPYGGWDSEVAEQVSRHYALAVTAEEGLNEVQTPLHQLRRSMVQPFDSMVSFATRLRWGWSPFEELRRGLRRGKRYLRRHGPKARPSDLL